MEERMRLGQLALGIATAALCACSRPQPPAEQHDRVANDAAPAPASAPPVVHRPVIAPAPPPPPAAAQAPVVDPKSSEAAEDIVRAFLDLLNRGRFDEAYMLLGPSAPPRADFDRQFTSWSGLHATMGTPGAQEGAAGSIYLSVPVQLTGRQNGKRLDRAISLVLRRVNDVPGSTEAQRHWHIERIDAQPG
jgi:hypothetical protein